MGEYSPACPFCGRPLTVQQTSRKECLQIVDLRARCACGGQIHAAGVGLAAARISFEDMIRRRRGKSVADWQIHPAHALRRGGR